MGETGRTESAFLTAASAIETSSFPFSLRRAVRYDPCTGTATSRCSFIFSSRKRASMSRAARFRSLARRRWTGKWPPPRKSARMYCWIVGAERTSADVTALKVSTRAGGTRRYRHRPAACSVRRGCKVIDLPRSTFYYRSTARALNLCDAELVAIIEDIRDELPCYGYRRVTHELQRRGHLVNHKRVARVMRANGLGIKPRKRYVRTTDSNHDSPIYPNLCNVIPARPI